MVYLLQRLMTLFEMRDIIRNERRIEMAFEEQRYWDIRRWRIAETIFEKPLRGLSIQVVGTKTNYHEVDVLSAKFDTKRYFYPIPYSEVIKKWKYDSKTRIGNYVMKRILLILLSINLFTFALAQSLTIKRKGLFY